MANQLTVYGPDAPCPYPHWSKEWYNYTLLKGLGYTQLHNWQLSLNMALCEGRDIVCIVATGAGKSALIQGPAIIYKAAGKKKCGIVIVPTKGLADDQAQEAKKRGIEALALHEDATRAATAKNENLFKQIKNGSYELIFLGTEMLTSPKFSRLLELEQFLALLAFIIVDECHLSDEWKGFRSAYQDVKRLRDRVPSRVAWGGISATVAPAEFELITTGLGFMKNQFELVREPVDRPDIKYVWIIPFELQTIDQIPITIIFVNYISFGHRLRKYLTSLLPSHIQGSARMLLIRGYHSLSSQQYRTESLEALRAGTKTRILLATNTGAFGINVSEVEQVIIAQLSETFKTQTQRIGRIREDGTAYIYFPQWMSTSQQSKTAVSSRSRVEPVMVQFANPSLHRCPRVIACEHWGEQFYQPHDCCSMHNPDELADEMEVHWRHEDSKKRKEGAQKMTSLGGPRATKQSRRPLNRQIMVPPVRQMLKEWRLRTWQTIATPSVDTKTHPESLLPDEFIEHLCDRLHVCTSYVLFSQVMSKWGGLTTWGANLYVVAEVSLQSAEKMWPKESWMLWKGPKDYPQPRGTRQFSSYWVVPSPKTYKKVAHPLSNKNQVLVYHQ
ncbi:hypothetical protein RSAG8_05164, partial [Rhizoctonia solani AG-8 WAC10335]